MEISLIGTQVHLGKLELKLLRGKKISKPSNLSHVPNTIQDTYKFFEVKLAEGRKGRGQPLENGTKMMQIWPAKSSSEKPRCSLFCKNTSTLN